jgi:hypothetical protein
MVEDKPYVLEGDSRKPEAYASRKATVTGLVTCDRTVNSTSSSSIPGSMGAATQNT